MTAVRSSERHSDDGGGLKLSAAAVVVQRKGKERRVVNKIRFNLTMWGHNFYTIFKTKRLTIGWR